MIATILKVCLTLFVALTLTACSWCEVKVPEYIDREVIVKVPVKCVVPNTNCNFDRETNTEVIASMLECIVDLKEAQKVCR